MSSRVESGRDGLSRDAGDSAEERESRKAHDVFRGRGVQVDARLDSELV